jgi:hypothetical protein
MARPQRKKPASHATQLRAEIDRGRTGDKVDVPDPSVAPLGTDDESAGQTPTPDQVGAALTRERSHDVDHATTRSRPTDPTVAPRRHWVGPAAALLLMFAGLVAVALFFAFPA